MNSLHLTLRVYSCLPVSGRVPTDHAFGCGCARGGGVSEQVELIKGVRILLPTRYSEKVEALENARENG